ncbi:MAG TPA: lytic transglycosylase domain-containing protein [Pyrinomonadaceae bacterium]|nr:lytic transglycosylase domain-containing protein [Pyrinomonadaceae bacterium]
MRTLLLFTLLAGVVPAAAQNRAGRTSDISSVISRAVHYHPAIRATAARYRVDPHLLWTIAYLETRFRPRLVSPKGARGLMQFIPATGRRYGLLTHSDLHDPIRSLDAAARYVKDLNTMFAGRIDLVLAGYNAGENAVIKSGYRVPRYRETRGYVSRGVSVFERIAGANILSLERQQFQSHRNKQTVSTANRPARRRQPAPARTRSTRSIYFSL